MSDMFPPTRAEVIAELERELKMRKQVFPRWVASKSLTQAEADKRIRLLEAAIVFMQKDAAGGA